MIGVRFCCFRDVQSQWKVQGRQVVRRTRVWRALARTCSTLGCGFWGSTFCLNGYNGTFHHAEKSLLNTLSTYITSTVSAITASSCNFVDFIDVDDSHTEIA